LRERERGVRGGEREGGRERGIHQSLRDETFCMSYFHEYAMLE
jgi:hypothetical protein